MLTVDLLTLNFEQIFLGQKFVFSKSCSITFEVLSGLPAAFMVTVCKSVVTLNHLLCLWEENIIYTMLIIRKAQFYVE